MRFPNRWQLTETHLSSGAFPFCACALGVAFVSIRPLHEDTFSPNSPLREALSRFAADGRAGRFASGRSALKWARRRRGFPLNSEFR